MNKKIIFFSVCVILFSCHEAKKRIYKQPLIPLIEKGKKDLFPVMNQILRYYEYLDSVKSIGSEEQIKNVKSQHFVEGFFKDQLEDSTFISLSCLPSLLRDSIAYNGIELKKEANWEKRLQIMNHCRLIASDVGDTLIYKINSRFFWQKEIKFSIIIVPFVNCIDTSDIKNIHHYVYTSADDFLLIKFAD